jgi:hypothetical protein
MSAAGIYYLLNSRLEKQHRLFKVAVGVTLIAVGR